VLRSGLQVVGSAALAGAVPAIMASHAWGDEPASKDAVRSLIGKNDPKAGLIDAHVHVWTPDLKRYPLAPNWRMEQMKPASFTPEQLFEHARPCGVSRVVLIQMSFYGFDNSYMLDSMQRFPGVFSGVAVIDEHVSDPAAEMRRLAEHGVRGFRIHPAKQPVDKWIGSLGMAAMWKCGSETNQAMCALINPEALPAVRAMCEKHPDTPLVIDHFGRIGMDGEIRDSDIAELCRFARFKNTKVKVSACYALGKKRPPYDDLGPMIRRLLDAFGAERLMWASDSPFQVDPGHTYRESIDLVRQRLGFLSESDRGWLLRKTAEQTFFS
jgi:predicted TIM-barrel fold metal-dependent hydrolase